MIHFLNEIVRAYSINCDPGDLINITISMNIKPCDYYCYYFSVVGLCEKSRSVLQVLERWWFCTVNAIVLSIVLIA